MNVRNLPQAAYQKGICRNSLPMSPIFSSRLSKCQEECLERTEAWFRGQWCGAVKRTFTASGNLHDWLQPKM